MPDHFYPFPDAKDETSALFIRAAEGIAKDLKIRSYVGCRLGTDESGQRGLRISAATYYAGDFGIFQNRLIQELGQPFQLIRSDLGNLKLSQIVPQTIASFRDDRLREVQASTVRRELNILSHVFETAQKEWLMPLPLNPVTAIKKPSPPPARTRRLTEDECLRIMQECVKLKNKNMAKLIMFAMETGMRRSEITSLVWEHVNLNDNTA